MVLDPMEGFKDHNSTTSSSPAVPKEFRTSGRRIRRCRICKRFMDYEVLIVHMKKFHGIDITTEMNKSVPPKRLVPKCEVEGCAYVARTPAAYYKHMRNKHPVKEKLGNCTTRCPLCQAPFNDPEDLVEHCRTEHEDEKCVVEMRTFQNVEECEKWKESLARTHYTAWIINHEQRAPSYCVLYYRCSRCEPGTSSSGVAYCTSFLKEFVYIDGAILVKYCTRHIDHPLSTRDLPLSDPDKDVIAGYLRQDIDEYVLLDRIRKKYPDPQSRLHWIRSDDIRNISETLHYEEKLEAETVAAPGISSIAQSIFSPTFDENPIPATALLEESSNCEDNCDDGGSVAVRPVSSEVPAESLLGCPSCIKLTEKVAELEALIRELSDRMNERDEQQLFGSVVKAERT